MCTAYAGFWDESNPTSQMLELLFLSGDIFSHEQLDVIEHTSSIKTISTMGLIWFGLHIFCTLVNRGERNIFLGTQNCLT